MRKLVCNVVAVILWLVAAHSLFSALTVGGNYLISPQQAPWVFLWCLAYGTAAGFLGRLFWRWGTPAKPTATREEG